MGATEPFHNHGSDTANLYNYGVDGITTRTENDGSVTLYNKNAHGDVVKQIPICSAIAASIWMMKRD